MRTLKVVASKVSVFVFLVLFLVLAGSLLAHAAELNLLSAYDVNIKESIVDIKGLRYRKVEYKGDIFFLRLLESEVNPADLDIICKMKGDVEMENQVYISTVMTKRTSLFIEGLKQTCRDIGAGKKIIAVDPNIQIGFVFDESKKSTLKNKKLYLNPSSKQVGVGAEL